MILRPGMIRLIITSLVGLGYAANMALAYIRGSKILSKKKKKRN